MLMVFSVMISECFWLRCCITLSTFPPHADTPKKADEIK